MALQPADYLAGGLVIVLAVMGLFRGLSGALAFLAGAVAAAAAAVFGWPLSAAWLAEPWLRGVATLVATLFVFGLVRLLVKKLVNGLLSQPSDAIFGFLAGVLVGLLLLVAWACTGFYTDRSRLATELAPYVQGFVG